MRTKKQHYHALRCVQKSICRVIEKVNREGHIPIWQLRTWGFDIKSAANFMQKEMKKKKSTK